MGTKSLYENGGHENAKIGKQYTFDLNFGELEFDWKQLLVTMRIIGGNNNGGTSTGDNGGTISSKNTKEENNGIEEEEDDSDSSSLLLVKTLLSAQFSMDQLSGLEQMPGSTTSLFKNKKHGGSLLDGRIFGKMMMIDDNNTTRMMTDQQQHLCMNYQNPPSHEYLMGVNVILISVILLLIIGFILLVMQIIFGSCWIFRNHYYHHPLLFRNRMKK